jgi:hypothetical protein
VPLLDLTSLAAKHRLGKMTLEELWGHFQANELRDQDVGRSQTTIDNYLSLFNAHIIRKWGNTFLEDVKAVDVEKKLLSLRWISWWTWSGSNRRPLPCHGSALPTAPQAHVRGTESCSKKQPTCLIRRSLIVAEGMQIRQYLECELVNSAALIRI